MRIAYTVFFFTLVFLGMFWWFVLGVAGHFVPAANDLNNKVARTIAWLASDHSAPTLTVLFTTFVLFLLLLVPFRYLPK